jgi:Spy/CpxP family protein refolding chaperone
MKKIISIFLILFSAFLIAQPPQQSPPEKRMERMNKLTAEQQATLWSKKMTLELDLNDTQEQQVYALVLSKANTHKKRRANRPKKRPNSEEMYQMQVDLLEEKIAMKKAMKSILTPEQYGLWEKSQKKKELMKKKHLKGKKKQKIKH